MGCTPAARCSGQLKDHPALSPPSAVRRSPVSVSCPVSSSKLLFISARTWSAMGASSCTAFSKWASLSFRLVEPPCVPSRRSSKWRIRLVIYAGIALSDIAYLLLRISVRHELFRTCSTCEKNDTSAVPRVLSGGWGSGRIQRHQSDVFRAEMEVLFQIVSNNQRTRSRRGHLIGN